MANTIVRVGNVDLRLLAWDSVSKKDYYLQSVSSKLAVAGAPSDGSRGRLGQRPSPGRAKSASSSQTPTANLRLPPPVAKLKLGTSSKDGRTSGSMSASRTKNIPTPGNQKMRLTERPSVAAVIVTVTKPALATGLAVTHTAAGSKLPVKAQDQGEGAKPSPLPSIQSQPGAGNAGARAQNHTDSCLRVKHVAHTLRVIPWLREGLFITVLCAAALIPPVFSCSVAVFKLLPAMLTSRPLYLPRWHSDDSAYHFSPLIVLQI
ncbi:hypothetical protein JZ751_005920 [Albula glossodonta]|uniref:Uncharacterized protein n=1 Tax=Albula glossodonta TaxID=121402 RepID=A0A8T2P0S6_9TELE|nr:hypothetical protein JZ751_005920 [Albula glossodonta]